MGTIDHRCLSATVGPWLLLVVLGSGCSRPVPEPTGTELELAIGAQIDEVCAQNAPSVGKERIHAKIALPRFYEKRQRRPAWLKEGCPLPRVQELVAVLRGAEKDGLRPADYHVETIDALLVRAAGKNCSKGTLDSKAAADLELTLTDAFLIYGSHLLGGRINPETLDPEWHAQRREADLLALLGEAIEKGIDPVLDRLRPGEPAYRRLQQALERYRKIAATGGFKPIGWEVEIKVNDQGPHVQRLRERLAVEGLLADPHGALFDPSVETAVRAFQERMGLTSTGVVDKETLHQLNVPAEDRVLQIEINLERWRWLPQSLGQRYIMAKIPSYELVVVDQDRVVLSMRAVVGKLYRRTPMLSSTLKMLVLNPAWQVPHKIAVKDITKEMRKDPGYLKKKGITIYSGWDADAPRIDPKTINWSKVTLRSFKYRLRQRPGRENALGKIKFLFPNKYDVYLHDTPQKNLFGEQDRTFSSGCIRLEKALELAEIVLRTNTKWTLEKIRAAIRTRRELAIPLTDPFPVHLTYFTAWVEPDGAVHFRKDIYRRDRRLARALETKPPPPAVASVTDHGV